MMMSGAAAEYRAQGKRAGTPVDFVAWEPFSDKDRDVIIILDASGIPEEITRDE
jgi:hypothetical protein